MSNFSYHSHGEHWEFGKVGLVILGVVVIRSLFIVIRQQ